MIKMTDAEFTRFVTYIQNNFGINLKAKRILIESRLSKELADRGLDTYGQLLDIVLRDKTGNEVDILLNKITTNHTFFMRESKHFTLLQNTILPELIKNGQKEINIWSAGCSSGPEPYTISMIANEVIGNKKMLFKVNILASDISQRVLAIAKEGTYEEDSLKELPKGWKEKYFIDNKNGTFTVKPEVKKNITFKTINLMDNFMFPKPFDVIFCRNVMIYFEPKTRDELVAKYYKFLKPGGYFFVGLAESVNRQVIPFNYLSPATYQK